MSFAHSPLMLFLVVTATWVAPDSTPAQVQPARFLKANQPSKRMSGSAKELRGPTRVFHIFCADEESRWTRQEKDEVLLRSAAAFRFIEAQSRDRNIAVSFHEHVTPDIRYQGTIPKKSQVNHIWTEKVIRAALGKSGLEQVADIRQQHAENVIFCLHVNKAALSYNLAFYDNVSTNYRAERMVCFASYPDGRATAAATYAHEVLHLFGAGDLYFPFDADEARKTRASRMFPDDVMYRVDYDLGKLNIGEYTAFRVGWTDELDPGYELFND